ncbi:Sad1 / UNC-like C-terminal domain containing protein [Elaphomyces granulatus]
MPLSLVLLNLLGSSWAGITSTDATTTAGASSQEHGQNGERDDMSSMCPAKSWRDVQGEYFQRPVCIETRVLEPELPTWTAEITISISTSRSAPIASPSLNVEEELDTESLLDNANFLSFEEWKKQNLAKIGQSAENVGRRPNAGLDGRRQPSPITNVLDSLGEDAEIELDFSGFGTEAPANRKPGSWENRGDSGGDLGSAGGSSHTTGESPAEGESHGGVSSRKDAGTTCKERFNYASFDCAATVLKTNPQCSGSSAVLIENKDSYMLNECKAKDKFIILELCDDILIDTIVLANYEFFSSIFRNFKVSVSDRYPVKLDKWKELGTFEARNTREVQAFAVENPLIWARYLKIEFLTHYGNEYYCPVSLIRIHGTTMMEEYKNDGEVGRAEEEGGDDVIEQPVQEPPNAEASSTLKTMEDVDSQYENASTAADRFTEPRWEEEICPLNITEAEAILLRYLTTVDDICFPNEVSHLDSDDSSGSIQTQDHTVPAVPHTGKPPSSSLTVTDSKNGSAHESTRRAEASGYNTTASTNTPLESTGGEQHSSVGTESKSSLSSSKEDSTSTTTEPTKTAVAHLPSPNPTTQESFFKSVNKRLQMLESNSSLSLLYIEEQSRILRDAFNKVEKRQLAKTTTFLENLNTTVLNELREFREQYDHVWKTVVIEFEHQRFQYHQELYSIATQLGILADELVFQKRVSIIQSIFVLVCLGLVLFSRVSLGNYLELPSVQSMVSRSHSLRSSSPAFGTPSLTPSSTRPTSSHREKSRHRRDASDDSQEGPTIAYSPPTPPSEAASSRLDVDEKSCQLSLASSRAATPEPPDLSLNPQDGK